MARTCAAVLALWIGAGCGTPGKPPVSGGGGSAAARPADAGAPEALALDRDYPRLAERVVKLYEAVAQALAAAGEDCARATEQLDALAATNRDVVAASVKLLHEGRARELKQALARLGEPLEVAAKAIVDAPAMATCAPDPAFTRAFDDLVGTPP